MRWLNRNEPTYGTNCGAEAEKVSSCSLGAAGEVLVNGKSSVEGTPTEK